MRRYALGLVVMAACGGGGGGNNGGGAKLKAKLDLSHVIGFAIVPQASARGPAAPMCMPSTLYALQEDGTMAVTTVTETTDDNGSASCTTSSMDERASAIFDTESYVLINYEGLTVNCTDNGMCDSCGFVLARKSDGALFCGTNMQGADRVESSGTTLYLKQGAALRRLDASMDPPTATAVNDPQQESVDSFHVNAAKDVLAVGSFGTRIFKANGGLMNLSVDRAAATWVNPADGDFYYLHLRGAGAVGYFEPKHLAAGTYAETILSTFVAPGGANMWSQPVVLVTASQAYTFGGQTILELMPNAAGGICTKFASTVCTTDVDCGSTATCQNTGNGPTGYTCAGGLRDTAACDPGADSQCRDTCNGPGGVSHHVAGVTNIKNALGYGNDIFAQGVDSAGNGMILKIDVGGVTEAPCCKSFSVGDCAGGITECVSSEITPTTLLAAGSYVVTAISLSKTGELTFAGLRNSDGARVVGNCVDGTCSVLNATAPMVTTLQRIN